MNNIEDKPSFQRAERQLQNLIARLEERLQKTDQASVKAQQIKNN